MTPRLVADRVLPRRALLAAGVAGLVGTALAGCTDGATGGPSARAGAAIAPSAAPSAGSSTDAAALQRARAAAAGLAAAADRLAAADPAHAGLLGGIAADHRAHLAVLGAVVAGAHAPTPSVPAPTPSGAAAASRLEDAVASEGNAARGALDDVQDASPPVAALLARIAAARAAHADLLAAAAGAQLPGPLAPVPAPTPGPSSVPGAATPGALPPAPSPPSDPGNPVVAPGTLQLGSAAREALVALTAGEHAAVFAYGLIAARVSQSRRKQARTGWTWHLARRDLLEERLLAAGVQPPVAAPAYDVGGAPNASGAARLAATVERRLGALAVRAVAATEGDDRREAATALLEVARRLAAWTGRPETLPG